MTGTSPALILSLPSATFADYVTRQINTLFPDGSDVRDAVRLVLGPTLERVEHCFKHIRIKSYWRDDNPQMNHLHTDQYAIFLYYLANTAYREGAIALAAKAYALNKALHAFEVFYEVQLPDIFAVMHPVGTVLGRGTYNDYLFIYQNVTVGADQTLKRPSFGEGVVMYAGSRVISDAVVGSNCMISAGTTILSGHVPDGHVAFGTHPHVMTKPTRHNVKRDVFKNG
jgi:serine O-acetyltransferase